MALIGSTARAAVFVARRAFENTQTTIYCRRLNKNFGTRAVETKLHLLP